MSESELVEELRYTARQVSSWDLGDYPPFTLWAELMEEAANRIEELEH